MASKPSLASVAAKMGPAEEEEDDGYSTAADELAEILGVAPDKVDAMKSAMEALIRSCK